MTTVKVNYLQKAFDAFNSGNSVRALSLVRKLNKQSSMHTFQSLEFEGAISYHLGKYQKACNAYVRALKLSQNTFQKTTAYERLGKSYRARLMDGEAATCFEKSLAVDASLDNAETIYCLAQLYCKMARLDDAVAAANQLVELENYFVKAHLLLVKCADLKKETVAAKESIDALKGYYLSREQFSESDGVDLSVTLSYLIHAKMFADALQVIRKAELLLGVRPGLDAQKALINVYTKTDEYPLILVPESLLSNPDLHVNIKLDLYAARAKLFDEQGFYDEAWSDYTNLGALKKRMLEVGVADVVKKYQQFNVFQLPVNENSQCVYQPVFMIGFPRSGTTLLDTILDTQENIVTVSEGESLGQVEAAIVNDLKLRYPNDLEKISPGDLSHLRSVYSLYVASVVGKLNAGTILIDKMPLNMIHIPLILSLFPEAKFIFSLRHPLDVCLSNFQQHFVNNREMNHLLTIEQCFQRYKQVFDLFSTYREHFDLNMHIVKYEELISDYDNVINAVFDFLGVTPTESYEGFYEHAKSLRILTPSFDQVRKPIYQSSDGKWKHYENYLKPYMPIVQSYVEQFGYSV